MRLGALQLGAAYMLMSGAPFTRMVRGATRDPDAGWDTPPQAYETNAGRGPAYSRMDAQVEWTGELLGSRLTIFGNVQNALRQYSYAYTGAEIACPAMSDPSPYDGILCRNGGVFWGTRSMTPSIGLRLRF